MSATGLRRHVRAFAGKGLALYGKVIYATAAFAVDGGEYLERAANAAHPTILATWHGQSHLQVGFLMGAVDLSRFVVIVPDDHRREVLESFAHSIGARPFAVGMSDETLAGARRLTRLIQALGQHGLCYVAPDGPDGPARVPKAGIAFVAEKSGAEVLPIGAEGWPCLHQRRWDRYIMPFPFARVSIAFRAPLRPPSREGREDWLRILAQELTAAKEAAAAGLLKRRA